MTDLDWLQWRLAKVLGEMPILRPEHQVLTEVRRQFEIARAALHSIMPIPDCYRVGLMAPGWGASLGRLFNVLENAQEYAKMLAAGHPREQIYIDAEVLMSGMGKENLLRWTVDIVWVDP